MLPSDPATQPPELIVALDVPKLEDAKRVVDILFPTVKLFKVGSQLFTAYGPEAVKVVSQKGGRVFLDLKFYDIPQTVYSSSSSVSVISAHCVESLSETAGIEEPIKKRVQSGIFMMTVHIQGGRKMLEESMKGAVDKSRELKIDRPLIVGVTVLTSDAGGQDILATVIESAKLAKEAGLDGVVCSVNEAAAVRKECGEDFIIVTPGIRPKGAASNDQKRIATPMQGKKAGANYIVVGRPILEAKDPLRVAQEILQEMSGD
jgi:orotidine-5'-phosphate decarboxylase